MSFTHLQYLVETHWLEAHLNDPNLRILDCTVLFHMEGRDAWAQSHIPGSGFVDIIHDLSDGNSSLPFTMPSATQFVEAMSRYGIGDGKRVILYDVCSDQWAHIWATRVWWMLRVHGFDNAAVLNGGWHKWKMEDLPVSTDPFPHSPAHFIPRLRSGLIADKSEVLATIGDNRGCLVNALTTKEHSGEKTRYGRPGHIPSSVNVPTVDLIDPVTHTYLPLEQLHTQFAAAGALDHDRVITYCGGGIAASSDAFILTLLGKSNVAVYDGSLLEWTADPNLPMETV